MTAYDENNIFKKILDGDIPSSKIFESEHSLAILDAFPSTPGHSLLIPKALVRNSLDMSEEVASQSLRDLPRLARAVQKATGCAGVNIIQNNEAEAGQMVFHAHFHVIPRNKDDKLLALPQSSKTMLEPSEAQKMVAKIQENLDAPAPPKSPETAASGSGVIVPVLTAACVVLGAVVVKLLQN